MTKKPSILLFASGTKDGGGSGFEQLYEDCKSGVLEARIVGVVCNRLGGGVEQRATKLKVPFIYFPEPWDAKSYQRIVQPHQPDLIILIGWLKLVSGLENYQVINEHPAPLPKYGGKGMFGDPLYLKLLADFAAGKLKTSAISYHQVTAEYDQGPVVFAHLIPILPTDTPSSLAERSKKYGHYCYGRLANSLLKQQRPDFPVPTFL